MISTHVSLGVRSAGIRIVKVASIARVMKDLSRTFLTQEEVRVVQCPGVVGQVDFDVVCIHHAVAVDVDLKRRVGTRDVHPSLRMRRSHEMGILGKLEELPIVIEQERRIRQGLPAVFDSISSPSWIEIPHILADFRKPKT
jgi:hypothetical protein